MKQKAGLRLSIRRQEDGRLLLIQTCERTGKRDVFGPLSDIDALRVADEYEHVGNVQIAGLIRMFAAGVPFE